MSEIASREPLAAIARLAMARQATTGDVRFLIACLGAARKLVQHRAAQTLVALAARGHAIAPALVEALASPSATRRWGAAFALAQIGALPDTALSILFEVLGSHDGDLRWAAAGLVTRMGARVVPELKRLATAGDPAQRKMALYCLRNLHLAAPEIQAVLLARLTDADAGVRLAALSALGRGATDRTAAAHQVLHLIADPNAGVRRAAISALGALAHRTPEIEHVLRGAAASTTDPGLRRAAEGALKRLTAHPS